MLNTNTSNEMLIEAATCLNAKKIKMISMILSDFEDLVKLNKLNLHGNVINMINFIDKEYKKKNVNIKKLLENLDDMKDFLNNLN